MCQVLPPCRAENSDSGNMDCHLVDLVTCDQGPASKLVPSTVGLHPLKIKMEPKDDDLESGR